MIKILFFGIIFLFSLAFVFPVYAIDNTITILDDEGNAGRPSIVDGSDGFPIISYSGVGGNLQIIHCTNATCSTFDTPVTLDVSGSYTSIAIGEDSFPVISYEDVDNTSLKFVHCISITCNTFDPPLTLDDSGYVGLFSSIAIGSDGYPVIAYHDFLPNEDLKLVHCTSVDCSSFDPPIIMEGSERTGFYVSLIIAPDGFPLMAYNGISGPTMKVLHCTNPSCTTFDPSTAFEPPGQFPSQPDIIIAGGLPLISYFEGASGALATVQCQNIACTSFKTPTIIDNSHQTGILSSIAFDTSQNLPIVAYHDSIHDDFGIGNLKVVKCSSLDCSSFEPPIIVDFGGLTGREPSIAFMGNGDMRNVVSYNKWGPVELRVAHLTNFDPTPDTDNDGNPDSNDLCVNEPETFNGFEDEDGCPDDLLLSAFTSSTPSVDGVVDVDEWSNAASQDFVTSDGLYSGTIFVMNDDSNLYIAAKIVDVQMREMAVFFDDNHNGLFEVGEDWLTSPQVTGYFDVFLNVIHFDASLGGVADTGAGGTQDGNADQTRNSGFSQFEFSHPLCSADTSHDFCLSADDTVGFLIQYGGDYWPVSLDPPVSDASDWGDIKVATAEPDGDAEITFMNSGSEIIQSPKDYLILPEEEVVIRAGLKNTGEQDLHLNLQVRIEDAEFSKVFESSKDIILSSGELSPVQEFYWTAPTIPTSPTYYVTAVLGDSLQPEKKYDSKQNEIIFHIPYETEQAILIWAPSESSGVSDFVIEKTAKFAWGQVLKVPLKILPKLASFVAGVFLSIIIDAPVVGPLAEVHPYIVAGDGLKKSVEMQPGGETNLVIFLKDGQVCCEDLVITTEKEGTQISEIHVDKNQIQRVGINQMVYPKSSFIFSEPGSYEIMVDYEDGQGSVTVEVVESDFDNDGIQNDVDTLPNDFSNFFNDEATTFGEIISRGGQTLTVSDLPDPDGIRVLAELTGSENLASVSSCEIATISDIDPGEIIHWKCGSVTINVISGPVFVSFNTGGVPATTTMTAEQSLTFDPDNLTITTALGTIVIVEVDGKEIEIGSGETVGIPFIPIDDGEPPPSVIGGEMIPIEMTTLLLVGMQSIAWLIPIILAIVGFGLVVASKGLK